MIRQKIKRKLKKEKVAKLRLDKRETFKKNKANLKKVRKRESWKKLVAQMKRQNTWWSFVGYG